MPTLSPRSIFLPDRSMLEEDVALIRAHIAALQRARSLTWTDAVEAFAAQLYRDPSAVWRWLEGTRRVPKSVLRNLPKLDPSERGEET